MVTSPAAFLVGREPATLPPTDPTTQDRLFAAQRIDGTGIDGRRFHHCTFANVSFKEVTLRNCEFLNCAFLNCYFRKAQIVNTSFVGSRFYDCDFPKASIQSCDFKYAQFQGCIIPKNEMDHNLPGEPNLKEELAAELAHSAETLGQTKEARAYRLVAIEAHQEDLYSAFRGSSTWYRSHYRGASRVGALLRLLGSKINGQLWGHGERVGVLLRNLVALTFLIFPALLYWLRDGLSTGDGTPPISELFWLSITTMLPMGGPGSILAESWSARIVLAFETFTGLVVAGLLVTLLFRSVVRR